MVKKSESSVCKNRSLEDLKKNDRQSATMNAEIRRHNRSRMKDIKNGVSLLSNKLALFDCAIMTSYNSRLSDEENLKNFNRLKYQAIDRGFLSFLIKEGAHKDSLTAEEVKDSVLCFVDFKGFETLEEYIESWAREYNQMYVLYVPKEGKILEKRIAGKNTSQKERSSYDKNHTCESFIGKLIRKPFRFSEAFIAEVPQPANIMGRWYLNSLLKHHTI